MPIHLLPSLLVSLFAVGYTPGPANIYALSCVLGAGRKRAMKAWLGLVCGFSLMAVIVVVLTHFAGLILGRYIVYVKYAGAAYMLYLAWKLYRSNSTELDSDEACSFRNGFIVQFTNAKMILFQLTVYSSFVLPYSERLGDLFIVDALLLIAGPGANLFWIMIGSFLRPFAMRYQKTVNLVMALALVACAILIALG